MQSKRQNKVFTDVSKSPQRSKASILIKTFIGSTLIFYGVIATIYFVRNNMFIPAFFCFIICILGLLLFKRPDPMKQLKKEMKKYDKYNSIS